MTTIGTRPDSPAKMLTSHANWWFYLISGTVWIIVAWIVLRFNLRSVAAVSVLAGVVVLLAAVSEFWTATMVRDWRWLHITLGVIFVATSIIVFIHPGNTFAWLAALIGWYLLFKGIADIILSFALKSTTDGWWLMLLLGIFQLIAGFWAAGHWARSAYLLVALVGVIALIRGIDDIITAFRVRRERDEVGVGPVMPA